MKIRWKSNHKFGVDYFIQPESEETIVRVTLMNRNARDTRAKRSDLYIQNDRPLSEREVLQEAEKINWALIPKRFPLPPGNNYKIDALIGRFNLKDVTSSQVFYWFKELFYIPLEPLAERDAKNLKADVWKPEHIKLEPDEKTVDALVKKYSIVKATAYRWLAQGYRVEYPTMRKPGNFGSSLKLPNIEACEELKMRLKPVEKYAETLLSLFSGEQIKGEIESPLLRIGIVTVEGRLSPDTKNLLEKAEKFYGKKNLSQKMLDQAKRIFWLLADEECRQMLHNVHSGLKYNSGITTNPSNLSTKKQSLVDVGLLNGSVNINLLKKIEKIFLL